MASGMSSSDKKINVVLTLKEDEFKSSLKSTNEQIKLTQSQLKLTSAQIKEYGADTKALADKQKALTASIDALNAKQKLYADNVTKNTDKLEKNREALKSLNDQKKSLNDQYKEAVKQYGKESDEATKLKASLDDVTKQYKEKENAIKSNINQINKYSTEINKVDADLVGLNGELKRTNAQIVENGNNIKKTSEQYTVAGEKMKAIGGGLSTVGSGLIKIGTIGASAGVAIAKMGMDFDKSIAQINTLLDDTSNLESYKQSIIDLSNDTGKSTDDLSSGMYQAISSLGDMGKETEKIFKIMAESAKAGNNDVSSSVSVISATMKGYGDVSAESATKVSDLIFQTAKLGVTTSEELAGSLGQVVPMASALGVSMEDLFGVFATGTGVVGNTAETTTKAKAMFEALIKPTKEMTTLMEKYGYANGQAFVEAEGLTGILEILKKETGGQADSMGKLFSSSEALTLALSLTGEQFDVFKDKQKAMGESSGATQTALEKVSETAGDKLAVSLNTLKNSFLENSDALVPFVEGLTSGVTKIAEVIGSLDAETVSNIATLSLYSLAIGGVAKVFGGLFNVVGSVTGVVGKITAKFATATTATSALGATATATATSTSMLSTVMGGLSSIALPLTATLGVLGAGLYAVHEAGDVLDSTILTATEDMSVMEKAMSGLVGATRYSKEELAELGYTYSDWNESIAPETQQALEDMATKFRELNTVMDEVNIDGVISEEESNALITRTNSLCDDIVKAINNKKEEAQKGLKEMFIIGDGVIDESEQKTLDALNKNADAQIKSVTELNAEMTSIYKKSEEEKRILTVDENARMEEIKKQLRDISMQNLVNSEEELMNVEADFNSRATNMNLEGLSTYIEEKAKLRDDETNSIKEAYDKQIEYMKLASERMTGEDKANMENQIKIKEEERNKALGIEAEKYDGYLNLAKEKYPQLYEQIDWETGKILTQEEQSHRLRIKGQKQMYADLESITETGYHDLYNSTTKGWDRVFVEVDEKTGKILNSYTTTQQQINGQPINMSAKLDDTANENSGKSVFSRIWDSFWGTKKKIENNPIQVSAKTAGSNGSSLMYANGSNYTRSGLASVNERGWELFDTQDGKSLQAISTAKYEMTNMPSGTKVTNHLQSTKKMNDEIKREVNNKLLRELKNTKGDSKKEVNINSPLVKLIVEGNITEDVMPEVQRMIKQVEQTVYKTINNEIKKNL